MLRSFFNNSSQHTTLLWCEKVLQFFFQKKLSKAKFGSITIHHGIDTLHINGSQKGPRANITIHNIFKMLSLITRKEDIGFAESYIKGYWTTTNLTECLLFFGINESCFKSSILTTLWSRLSNKWQHFKSKNSLHGSKKNISFHYDLGNDFYKLWLDKTMTYSSGIYLSEADSLEQAQSNKYHRIYKQLNAKKGATILEIGCGWGGFAEYATKKGNPVEGITLSNSQLEYCNKRLSNQKHHASASFQLLDYRDLKSTYHHIVSIEMFEAVGEQYWDSYFSKLTESLKTNGTAVLQIITISELFFESYRNKPDFIQLAIFPGGMLPTRSKVITLAKKHGFQVNSVISIGASYTKTLQSWLKKFTKQYETLESTGFDKKFRKTWKYYLCYCIAGFMCNRIDTIQITLKKTVFSE